MKTKITQVEPEPSKFRPVEITLRFETQEELDRFASGINISAVADVLFGTDRWHSADYVPPASELCEIAGANPKRYYIEAVRYVAKRTKAVEDSL